MPHSRRSEQRPLLDQFGHAHSVDLAQNRTTPSQLSQLQDSIAFLPATVLESQLANAESPASTTAAEPTSLPAMAMPQQTNSQPDILESTQPISQSIYDSIIRRSKSIIHPDDSQIGQTGTQYTLKAGDRGHVDIMSSFITGNDEIGDEIKEVEDDEASENADFSPTQSEHNLTQFPESQRFKTPATAGKKRNYNGEIVATPMLPRNPLRNGDPTPGRTLGLSQAFAGTQAATSPFSNGLPTGPRSDRPSPNIELQTRPASASDSSPLRPISEFRRAVTEPAARYVSVRQSQAERQLYEHLDTGIEAEDEHEDTFEEEPDHLIRSKRQKEREMRVGEELRRFSSPIAAQHDLTSNRTPNETDFDHTAHTVGVAVIADQEEQGSGLVVAVANNESDSEAETEHDEGYVGSSQPEAVDEEDKENLAIDVPRTVTSSRLRNFINGSLSQVDASPITQNIPHTPLNRDLHSSAFQDVPNSQPGEYKRGPSASSRVLASSERSERDNTQFVNRKSTVEVGTHEQAAESVEQPDMTTSTRSGSIKMSSILHEQPTINILQSDPVSDAIPETSSDLAKGQNSTTRDDTGPSVNVMSNQCAAAATHRKEYAQSSSPLPSSQPVCKTPPGMRRKRLIEISAEKSPVAFTPGFDVKLALQLDEDQGDSKLLMSSPSHKHDSSRPGRSNIIESPDKAGGLTANENRAIELSSDDRSRSACVVIERFSLSENPQSSNSAQASALEKSNYGKSTAPKRRKSVYDYEESPQKSTVRTNERKKAPGRLKSKPRMLDRLEANKTTSEPITGSVMHDDGQVQAQSKLGVQDLTGDTMHKIVAPNMIFACFNGTSRAYYPALCLGFANNTNQKYTIQWEGYEPDEVDVYGVRPLDLRIGDAVKVNLKKLPRVPYIVRGFKDSAEKGSSDISDIRGYRTLLVTPKQRKSSQVQIVPEMQIEVPVNAIYLDSNMWNQMKGREFEFYSTTESSQSGFATPVFRAGTPSTPSSRRRPQTLPVTSAGRKSEGLFASMVFLVSYEDVDEKNTYVSLIESQGGLVLKDSFVDLLDDERIMLRDQFSQLGFAALITEQYSRKAKYLQALALGLPCLSGRWINACMRHSSLVDWQTYLLPAGESVELDGSARSRILPSIACDTAKLRDLIDSRAKLLSGDSIIIITGRGKSEAKRLPYLFLLTALGAAKIGKAIDPRSAYEYTRTDAGIEWVIVEERDVESTRNLFKTIQNQMKNARTATAAANNREECKVVSYEFIVQSLILGKLLEG